VIAGVAVAAGADWLPSGDITGGRTLVLLPSVVVLMFSVGLLAAIGPARRGLAVQPTEALREERGAATLRRSATFLETQQRDQPRQASGGGSARRPASRRSCRIAVG